jgi:hypothetical protein
MPRGDRTGPFGSGPRTGRGAGYCGGTGAPGFASGGPGAGISRGAGRGWRRWFRASSLPGWLRADTAAGEKGETGEDLVQRMNVLREELDVLKRRLNQLKNEGAPER